MPLGNSMTHKDVSPSHCSRYTSFTISIIRTTPYAIRAPYWITLSHCKHHWTYLHTTMPPPSITDVQICCSVSLNYVCLSQGTQSIAIIPKAYIVPDVYRPSRPSHFSITQQSVSHLKRRKWKTASVIPDNTRMWYPHNFGFAIPRVIIT